MTCSSRHPFGRVTIDTRDVAFPDRELRDLASGPWRQTCAPTGRDSPGARVRYSRFDRAHLYIGEDHWHRLRFAKKPECAGRQRRYYDRTNDELTHPVLSCVAQDVGIPGREERVRRGNSRPALCQRVSRSSAARDYCAYTSSSLTA